MIFLLTGNLAFSQDAYYTNLQKNWDKIVEPQEFNRLRIRALFSSKLVKTPVNSNNQSFFVYTKEKSLFDISKSKSSSRQAMNIDSKQPDIYVDISCLNESRPGIPVVFQIRIILLRRFTWESSFDSASLFIFKSVNMYKEELFWNITDNDGKQVFEQVYSPSFFSNEPNPDNIMTCGILNQGPSSTWFDLMPGMVFTTFFTVPSPTLTKIKQLKFHWNNLSCDVPIARAFESDFVGNSEIHTLNYTEYQNILLFSQKKQIDPCYYPFGDWALENHLSSTQLRQFEKALQKKDVYAFLLYYQYFAINHISLHKINRKYLPSCSLNVHDPVIRLGKPYKFGDNPPSESTLKTAIELSTQSEPIAESTGYYYKCIDLPYSNWNWEIIRKSYNSDIIGNWDSLPNAIQINLHKFLFDRKKQSHPDMKYYFIPESKLYNFFSAEKNKSLNEFMMSVYKLSLFPSNLDLHQQYNNTLPLD